MKKRTWIILAAAATVALLCAWWNAYGGSDIVLPQQELQQKINAKLPFVTKGAVTISQAQLDLSGNKLGLTVAASATRFHATYTLKAHTAGELEYDNMSGSFYFHPTDLHVIDADVGDVSVPARASEIFDKLVKSEKLRAHKDALIAEAAKLFQSELQRAADGALNRVPVYTLKHDFTGTVARMALSSVEIKDGNLIAHMSFLQFGGMCFLYLGVFIVILLIGGVLVAAAANGVALPFFL